METTITTTRERVFRLVARRMEWQGTRSGKDSDLYGRIAISEADNSLLHNLFDEASMHAIDICRPFLISVSNTENALTLRLSPNACRDEAAEATLGSAITGMLAAHVLAQWQEIVSPERAAASYSKRDDYASKVQSILYHHPAPVRQPTTRQPKQ